MFVHRWQVDVVVLQQAGRISELDALKREVEARERRQAVDVAAEIMALQRMVGDKDKVGHGSPTWYIKPLISPLMRSLSDVTPMRATLLICNECCVHTHPHFLPPDQAIHAHRLPHSHFPNLFIRPSCVLKPRLMVSSKRSFRYERLCSNVPTLSD